MSSMHFMKVAAVLFAALMFGCGDNHDEGAPTKEGAGHHDDGGHDGHDHDAEEGDSDIETALKGLSDEDQKLALAQKTCPVSGEELGSMGTPIKVSGAGKTVFLCCKGCVKKFEANPEKYVEKLGE